MKYRDHRGGLKESMDTVIEVNTIEELATHLNRDEPEYYKVVEIRFEYCGWDVRVGWDTWYVVVRRFARDWTHCAGMSDGIFNDLITWKLDDKQTFKTERKQIIEKRGLTWFKNYIKLNV